MVPITFTSVVILVAVFTSLLLLQPTFLGVSASICGEKKPGWGTRLAAILIAGVASSVGQLAYSLTFGWMLARLGTVPVALGAVAVGFGVTSVVYSAFLRISVARAAAVAGVYWLISAGTVAVFALAVRFLFS